MDAIWHLDLLGRLQVRPVGGGEAITRFRTQKAAALLARLAMHPGPQPREALMALLWPDAPPDAARNSLSVALSSLRHQLEPPGVPHGAVLTADRYAIGLRDGALRVDALDFQSALRAARRAADPERIAAALALYGGAFLPGFYDDDALAQRDALAGAFRDGLAALLPHLPPSDAANWLRRATALDPDLADDYRRQIPPQNPSLAEGQGCTLAEGQGGSLAEPAPLERRAERTPLPAYPTRFFGRQIERARLIAALDESRLVTVTGPGGMGKTRFAVEALRTLAQRGTRVALVALAGVADGARIPAAIAAALHLPPGAEEPERLADALADSSPLLLLDNLEQMGDTAAEPIAALLERVPALRIVATSRRPIGAPGERLMSLAPLPLVAAAASPEALLAASPAVALFVDRARAALPDFALTPRNADAVVALCRRLDGIPLALELAASRARVLSPGQWLQRLESGLDAVAATSRAGVPERHRTLLATLRWSYDLLPPEAQRFLPQLSVFRGGWSLEAAEAVTGDPLALDYLAVLCENSLVGSAPTDDGAAIRFTLLETVREFAASLPGADDPGLAARHRDFFTAAAADQGPRLKTGAEPEALAWFAAEEENLRAALAAAPDDTRLPLAADVGRYWERRGAYAEAVRWLEASLAAHPGHDTARAVAHSILGNIAHNRGDFARAEAEHRASLRLREAAGDDQGAAMALNNLSLIASLRQDLPTARALAERALDLHRRAGNDADAAIAQANLANLHGYAGDWDGAERLYRATVPTLRAHRSVRALAVVYANLCVCAAQRGALDEAEGWARDSVALKTELGDRFGLAESLDTLAQTLHARGVDDEARACLDTMFRLIREVGAWRLLPVALLHRAQVDADAHPERAARLLGAALGQQRELVGGFAPHEQAGADTLTASLTAFAAARAHGERLTREEAIALALESV